MDVLLEIEGKLHHCADTDATDNYNGGSESSCWCNISFLMLLHGMALSSNNGIMLATKLNTTDDDEFWRYTSRRPLYTLYMAHILFLGEGMRMMNNFVPSWARCEQM